MQFEARVKLTPRLFRSAVVRHWLRFCGRDFGIAVVGTVAAGVAWTILGYRPWFVAAVGGISIFGLFGTGTVLVLYLLRARQRLREMNDPHESWSFSEDGLTRVSELGSLALGWASVEKLWRFSDVWLVFLGEESWSALPRASLNPMLEAFITRQVQVHGGVVR